MHKKLTTEEFVSKAKAIHGTRYDYSLVQYTKYNVKVKIICKEHGIFEQTPNNHLSGKGCIKCSCPNHGLSNKEYFELATKVHGKKYDYSKSQYRRMCDKIVIICPQHGSFTVGAQCHLRGQGCPKCKRDLQYKRINGHVSESDDFHIKDISGYEGLYKITSDGRVFSVRKGDWLLPTLSHGYLVVNLWKDKVPTPKRVHRLVAEAFISNPENKSQINHLDENKCNNRVENLEWATALENIQWGTRTEREIRTKRKNTQRVLQLTKSGLIVKEWECAKQAVRELRYKTDKIAYCCKGKRKTFMGFKWKYKNGSDFK